MGGPRVLAAAILVASSALGVPGAHAAPTRHVCQAVAFSPDFAHDGTAFCVTLGYQADGVTGDGTAVAYRTTDRGRSWQRRASQGLSPLLGAGVKQVLVSPAYPADHTVYVHVAGRGLLGSTDGGDTWLPADQAGDSATDHANYTALPGTPAVLAFADQVPALVAPPLHVPVAGTPGTELQFLADAAGATFAASLDAGPDPLAAGRSRLYACDTVLACTTALFTFPAGQEWQNGWLDPAYATNHTIYAVTVDAAGRPHAWRSADAGRTFTVWSGLEAMLAGIGTAYRATLSVATRAGSRTMFARLSFRLTAPGAAPPGEQILRSDDAGRSWRRVAYQLAYGQQGRRGTLPWNHPGRAFALGGALHLLGDGTLMTLAEKAGDYEGPFCSTDGGRSWGRTCR